MDNQSTSIKDQIDLLNSEVKTILDNNESLNSEALMTIADTVKDVSTVPSEELAILNSKIAMTPIESNNDILREAIGSVADLKELLRTCHGILNQVYTQIASLDISEPKMIEAAAAFVAAMKDTIQAFIDLYRDEQNFLHNVMLKKIDFEHKKELIKYKHDLEMSKGSVDISSTISYSQEALIDAINSAI